MANMTIVPGAAGISGPTAHFDSSKSPVAAAIDKQVVKLNNLKPETGKSSSKKRKIRAIVPPKPKLSSEELAHSREIKIFRQGLDECAKNVGAALVQLRKNPKSLGAFNRICTVSEHYAIHLTPSKDPVFRRLQEKILQPLGELIASIKSLDLQQSVRTFMPLFPGQPQKKTPEVKRAPDPKEPPRPKRSVQAGGTFPANFDLKTLNGINGFAMKGIAAGDYLGSSVSTAGDFNGDGLDDIVMGAALASPGGRAYAGSAFALLGQKTGWTGVFNLANLTGINGFRIDGLATGDALGGSVSTAGDFNGDGFQDIILGAPSSSPGGLSNAGSAFVIFGNSTSGPAQFDLATLSGINGFSVPGLAAQDQLGQSVSKVGDINGDGIDDIVLGAYNASPAGHPSAGKAYVIFGQRSGIPAQFNLASLNGVNGFEIDGIIDNGFLGWSVGAAGDINGDGIDDVVLGAYYASPGGVTSAGTTYVVFGKATGWTSSFDLTTLNGINGFVVNGVLPNDFLGSSVKTAGDINGDGIDDLLLGADDASPGGLTQAGSTYALFGHTGTWTSPFNLTTLNGINGFVVPGQQTMDLLGSSVSTAGDINGDGIVDVVLGAYYAASGGLTNVGKSSVIFGHTGTWPAQFNLTSLDGINGFNVAGLGENYRLGSSVGTAGDFNGDGIGDVILGSPGNGTLAGETYVIFGTNISSISPSPTSTPTSAIPPTQPTSTSTPTPTPTSSVLIPISINLNLPLNLNQTLTLINITYSNNTATITLIDAEGFEIVYNGTKAPIGTPLPPLVVSTFQIGLGNGTLAHPPILQACTIDKQCSFSNATLPLGQTFDVSEVPVLWIGIGIGGTVLVIGIGAAIFYFAVHKPRQKKRIERYAQQQERMSRRGIDKEKKPERKADV